jgi:ribose 5-phosphate isomerase B
MQVVIGSVVKGFALKQAVRAQLEALGHEVIDVGCYDTDRFAKFPSVAQRAAHAIQTGEADCGILCCGSGTGMALAAGKFAGICAVSCESVDAARFARAVNDANVLCMGESLVTPEQAAEIARTFMTTAFHDVPGIPARVLAFWTEARDEITPRGIDAAPRDIEYLPPEDESV